MRKRHEQESQGRENVELKSQKTIEEINSDSDFMDGFMERNAWANQKIADFGRVESRADVEAVEGIWREIYVIYEKENEAKKEVHRLFEREIGKQEVETGIKLSPEDMEKVFDQLSPAIESLTMESKDDEKISNLVDELDKLAKEEKECWEREKKLRDTLNKIEGRKRGVERELVNWKKIQMDEGTFSPGSLMYKFWKSKEQKKAAERIKFFESLKQESGGLEIAKMEYESACLGLLNESLKLTSAFEVINDAQNKALSEYMAPVNAPETLEDEMEEFAKFSEIISELKKFFVNIKGAVLSEDPARRAGQEKTIHKVEQLGSKISELDEKPWKIRTTSADWQELLALVEEADGLKEEVTAIIDPDAPKKSVEEKLYKILRQGDEERLRGIGKLSDEDVIQKFFYDNQDTKGLEVDLDEMKKDGNMYKDLIAVTGSFREMTKSGHFLDAAYNIRKDFDRVMDELSPGHVESERGKTISWIYYDLAEQKFLNKKFRTGDPVKDKKIQSEILNKRIGKEVNWLVSGTVGSTVELAPEIYLEMLNKNDDSYQRIINLLNNIRHLVAEGTAIEDETFVRLGDAVKDNLASMKASEPNADLQAPAGKFFDNLSAVKEIVGENITKISEAPRKNAPEALKLSRTLKEWHRKHPKLEVAVDEEKIWKVIRAEVRRDIEKEMDKVRGKDTKIRDVGHSKLSKSLEGIISRVGGNKKDQRSLRDQVIRQLQKTLSEKLPSNKKTFIRGVILDLKKLNFSI